jgi:hypothetical protein
LRRGQGTERRGDRHHHRVGHVDLHGQAIDQIDGRVEAVVDRGQNRAGREAQREA